MMLEAGFGTTNQKFFVPEENLKAVLGPNTIDVAETGEALVAKSLNNLIGTPRLCEIVNLGEKIVIITSDITRPVPSYKIIPSILEEFYKAGVDKSDITVIFALGCHRKLL